jgi:fibronectin type 3 domain-containing protein
MSQAAGSNRGGVFGLTRSTLLISFFVSLLLSLAVAVRVYALPYGNPLNVTASDGTDITVEVAWDAVCGPYLDHYEIQYTYDPGLSWWSDAGSVPALTCAYQGHFYHTPDYPYRTIYYRVLSCPEEGYACASPPFDYDTGHSILEPPGVSASDSLVGWVHIDFTPDDHATYYQAYRAASANGPYTYLGDSNPYDPSYTDSTASPGVTYYYKGKSCSDYGCSDLSYFWDYGSRTTGAWLVQASDGTDIFVHVTWETLGGVDYYRVYRTSTETLPGPGDLLEDVYDDHYVDSPPAAYTQYYYWVVSCVGTSCSSFNAHDAGWRTFLPPLPPAASDGTYTDKVSLSWTVSETFNNYKIYRSETSGGEKVQVGTSATTSFDDLGATPGVVYFYRIVGCDSIHCSGYSGANTGWMAWTAPGSVAATDGTSTAYVEVSWDGPPGSTSYQVYRCTGASTATCGSAIASPTASPYQDTGASPGVIYYYRVKACAGASNCSDYSGYDTGWRVPSPPTNVQASDGTYTDKVQVTWNVVSGATSYNVYRATASDGTKTLLGSPTAASFDDTSATRSRTFYYWVTTCVGSNCSDFSTYDTGWRILEAPANLQASDGTSSDHVALMWDSVTGAGGYRVYRALTESGTKTIIANLSGTSYEDTTAVYGQTYYYWVAATAWANYGILSAYDTGWRAWPYQLYLPLILR